MTLGKMSQSLEEIRIEGQGNSLVINQVVSNSSDQIKLRPFLASSPYIGLGRFEERHQDYFFGRDQMVALLLQSLARCGLLLVAGASGSGKSSVVRAGLLPRLGEHRPAARFLPIVLTPDRDPFLSLRGALLAAGYSQHQTECLALNRPEALVETIRLLLGPDDLWLLFVDQFEEIFTLCPSLELRQFFIAGLVHVAQSLQSQVKIVLAIRADFIDRFDPYPEFARFTERGLCLVTKMSASELRAAIEKPAACHGVVFESGLIEQIIADVQGRPGALPLLQFTLDLLWRECDLANDRTLNTASYRRVGGVEGSLRLRADLLYQFTDLHHRRLRTDSDRESIRYIFLRLVDLTGHGSEGPAFARRASRNEFTDLQNWQLINELVDEKLLVSDAARGGAGTVEIAHEALLSAWPTLQKWIAQGREVIYLRNRLTVDSWQWAKVNTSEPELAQAELWTGTRLQRAIALRTGGDFRTVLGGLTKEEENFLEASRAFSEECACEQQLRREQRMRLFQLGATLLGFLVVMMSGIAYYANRQRLHSDQNARIARARLLSSQSASQRDVHPDMSLLLAAHAWWLHPEYDSANALASALTATNTVHTFLHGPQGRVAALAFRRDGSELAAGDASGAIWIFRVSTGTLITQLQPRVSRSLNAVAYSPSGGHLAAVGQGGSLGLWDFAGSSPRLNTLQTGAQVLLDVDFSADGQLLAAGGEDGRVYLWEVASRRALPPILADHAQGVFALRFSPRPGPRQLAVGSGDGSISVWAMGGTQPTRSLITGARNSATSTLRWRPDGQQLAAGGDDGSTLFDLSENRTHLPIRTNMGATADVAFSVRGGRHQDEHLILGCEMDGLLRIAGANSGTTIGKPYALRVRPVSSCAISPDGKLLAVSGESELVLWDLTMHSALHFAYALPSINAIAVASLGHTILLGGTDGAVRLWDAKHEIQIGQPWLVHRGPVNALAYATATGQIFSAGADGKVGYMDTGRSTESHILPIEANPGGAILSLAYSPLTRRLAAGRADGLLLLWELDKKPPRQTSRQTGQLSLPDIHFSPNGELLATAGLNQSVILWSLPELTSLGEPLVHHKAEVTALDWSPDGLTLASASRDKSVLLWHLTAKLPHVEPTPVRLEHPHAVVMVKFNPDGQTLAAATDGKQVFLWDVLSGQKLGLPFAGHVQPIRGLEYLSNELLVSADSQALWRWNVGLGDGIAKACARANRNFTQQEWQSYFPDRPYCMLCTSLPSSSTDSTRETPCQR